MVHYFNGRSHFDDSFWLLSIVPARVEILHPSSNWQFTWRLARLRGLGSELCSFLFKLLHLLLPTQDRVHRMAGRIGQSSDLCKLCGVEVETPVHALFYCGHNLKVWFIFLKISCELENFLWKKFMGSWEKPDQDYVYLCSTNTDTFTDSNTDTAYQYQ